MANLSPAQAAAEALWRSPPNLLRAYAKFSHGQLHYRIARPEKPSGVPLMLFHQTGSSGRCYERFIAEMGTDRIAIAVDTPGFGASDPLPFAPSIADFATVMGELIDHLGLPEVDVIGDHTGSKTALEIGIQRPKQVRRVVMNAAAIMDDADIKRLSSQDHAIHNVSTDGEHIMTRWRSMVKHLGGHSLTLGEMEFIEGLRPGPFTWHGHNASFPYPVAEKLPQLTQPVLVLRAKDDLWGPTGRAQRFIRNGKVVELPEYGREMFQMRHRELAVVVRDFLDRPWKA